MQTNGKTDRDEFLVREQREHARLRRNNKRDERFRDEGKALVEDTLTHDKRTDELQFRWGDWAKQVEPVKDGDRRNTGATRRLQEMAGEIGFSRTGRSFETLLNWRWVAHRWPQSRRRECSWSTHEALSGQDDRFKVITDDMKAKQARDIVEAKKKREDERGRDQAGDRGATNDRSEPQPNSSSEEKDDEQHTHEDPDPAEGDGEHEHEDSGDPKDDSNGQQTGSADILAPVQLGIRCLQTARMQFEKGCDRGALTEEQLQRMSPHLKALVAIANEALDQTLLDPLFAQVKADASAAGHVQRTRVGT